MIRARAPLSLARAMLSRMKSSTAGLMLPSMAIQSTCAEDGSLDCAITEKPAAIRIRKKTILSAFTIQLFHDFFDVFPNQFFVRGIAQQIRRVQRRHQLDSVVAVPVATYSSNRNFALQQRLHGKLTQSNDDFWPDQVDLFLEKRFTRSDFVRFGISILGRATLDDIRDIYVFTLEAHAFGNDIGKQLPGPPDKWLALQIFIAARTLSDKHQLCFGIAHAENQMRPPWPELAAVAIADRSAQFLEIFRLIPGGRIREEIVLRPTQKVRIARH